MTGLSLTDHTKRLGVLAYLSARVKAEDTEAREQGRSALIATGMKHGGLVAELDDGTEIADVTLKRGAVSAYVSDEKALVAWLKEHHDTEIETVQRPRRAFLGLLLDNAKKAGIAVTANGEVIPGIEVTVGDPTLQVVPRSDVDDAILSALTRGELTVRALPGGDA